MKNIFLLFFTFLSFNTYSQYSNYYRVNSDVDVSGSINVSSNVNVRKTIETIDYGALAQANAIREKTRFERVKYKSDVLRRRLIAIANNPVKAYDYGEKGYTQRWKRKERKPFGKKYVGHEKNVFTLPHSSLFEVIDKNIINVSNEGITTSLFMLGPVERIEGHVLEKNEINLPLEKIMKQEQYEVGDFVQFTDPGINQYLHKKSVKRANVWKKRGFLGTYVLEDAYEKRILDFYASEEIDPITKEPNYINIAYVEYYGDKDEVSFEDLEGRRYYFRRLLEKVIASAYSW